MRMIRNLTALAVVLVVGTACQSDVTGPVSPTRNGALVNTAQESPAQAVEGDSAVLSKNNGLKSRYAMAAN